MVKTKKSPAKKEWVYKGEHRKEIRSEDTELFPYWKGHQSLKDLRKVAEELLAWSLTTESVNVSAFPLEKGMHPQRMYDWMERSPELKEAWGIAKLRIGENRERRGLQGDYNSAIVLAKMPMFDPEYRAWKEQQLAGSTQNTGAQVIVNMIRIESDIKCKDGDE